MSGGGSGDWFARSGKMTEGRRTSCCNRAIIVCRSLHQPWLQFECAHTAGCCDVLAAIDFRIGRSATCVAAWQSTAAAVWQIDEKEKKRAGR